MEATNIWSFWSNKKTKFRAQVFLECDHVSLGEWFPTFRINTVP